MNRRKHAMLARMLIAACGTLAEASRATERNISVPQLSDYQSATGESYMPADVIADLELYCGEPIYSRALFETRPECAEARDLVNEACEAAEGVALLQREVRLAAVDGKITPAERTRLQRRHAEAMQELAEVGDVLERAAQGGALS
jgi:hypothetical protein